MKKSQLEGFEVPKTVRLEAEPVETSRPEGELSTRPFELGKPVSRASESDDSPEDKVAFGFSTVKKGTVEGFSIPIAKKSEPESKEEEANKDEAQFEWGKPLLGGSSDEEDYGDEDGAVFDEVSIPLQRSVRRTKKPDQEVIEEYVDDEGRQVKRISKVTTTRTITRVEKGPPTEELAIDVPAEPREDVEEYIDEHDRRVRRVLRTSVTTSTKTVLRDGSVKVVLTPGEPGQQELREGPEETERIQTFTSEHGHRTQKLTKTTFQTQLKGREQPVTVTVPQKIISLKDDHISEDQAPDEDVRFERLERNVSYPEWLVAVKEKSPTPREVSISSIQIEPHAPELPTAHETKRPQIIEQVSASIIERHPPVISLQGFEDDEESPPARDRKRIEPPEGLPQSPKIPRKKVHKEIPPAAVNKTGLPSSTASTEGDEVTEMEVEEEKEGDEPMDEDEEDEEEEYDEFDEEIVVMEIKRRPRIPKWLVVRPDEPKIPVKSESLSYPLKTTSVDHPFSETPEITEDLSCVNIDRKVTIPELSDSDLLPGYQDDQAPTEIEEYVDENGVRVRKIVKQTITTKAAIRKSTDGKRDEPQTKAFESADPVYLDTDSGDVVPSVYTRQVILPEWMVESEQMPEKALQPEGDVSLIILPPEPKEPESKDLDREDVGESVTATTLNREIVIPEIDGMEDESPEEVEEYVDENGVRMRKVVKRTITTRTVKREDQQIEPMEVTFPVAQAQNESPEEIEEYVDENGVRVRRIVRRTITTRTVIRTSVGDKIDEPPTTVFESAAPVYLEKEPEEVVPSVQTREVVLPEWMVESEPTPQEALQPEGDVSLIILPSEPKEPESKDLDREDVGESVTATTLNRAIVIPEIDGMEDETPEEVEEYVDENGVRVKRIVKRTITTRTIKREDEKVEPMEATFPVAQTQDESPEEVEECIDENGVRVRRIVRRTITTRTVIRTSVSDKRDEPPTTVFKSGVPVYLEKDPEEVVPSVQTREVALPEWMVESEPTPQEALQPEGEVSLIILPSEPREPELKDLDREDVGESVTAKTLNREIVIPEIDGMEDESPEEVEEYVDENGVRVKRIVRRTITTRTIKREDEKVEPMEVTFPVAQTQDESPEEVEEYVDENGVHVRRIVRRTITTRTVIRTSVDDKKDEPQRNAFESADPFYLDTDSEVVVPSVQTREVVLPEWMVVSEPTPQEALQPEGDVPWIILPSQPKEPEFKEDLEREGVRESVTATTLNRKVVIPEIDGMEDESPEEVEEYVDENGVRVRRIVKRTITTGTVKREVQESEPLEVTFPVAETLDESPEEIEEYVDESGVRVRRIVRRTITTRTVIRTSVGDKRDESPTTVFESTVPVYLEKEPEEVVPSVQTREVVLPEWMVESEPTPREALQPEGDVSLIILPPEPKEPESKDLGREDVRESVTVTTLNREIIIPKIDGIEDDSPQEVEEYVDENGVRVRRLVKRTITTRTIKREDQQVEPLEVTFPGAQTQDESPEEVEEYVDENGVQVRRIVRRTITTRTVIRTAVDAKRDEPRTKVFESAAPVYLDTDSEDVLPSVQTREVVLPEWMVESAPTPQEMLQPEGKVSLIILPSEPKEPELKEDLEGEDVRESVTATTLNREIVIPEIDEMEDQSPEEVEEYVDENGVRVKRIIRRTFTTRTIKRDDQKVEPMEVTFPVAQTQDESPEEVEEYIDENGVRVRRIVRRTITTRTVIRTSVGDKRDEPPSTAFESAVPVYLEKEPEEVVPSVQTGEVVLPEWMVEIEPTPHEGLQPEGNVSLIILPSEPREPESKDLEREDVRESVTATTLNHEIVIPEIDGMEDESPEEVEEYVDENGVRVKRIVKRTITTRTIKREDEKVEPMEVSFPVAQTQDESPEEVEEYIDENGVRLRRIVRRTITTRTVIRTSVDGKKDEPQTEVFESADPVCLDTVSEDVLPSVQTREVVLPEWMVESERTAQEALQPEGDVSLIILPSEPKEPESKDLDREDVGESVTATTLNREIVIPEIYGTEDESPEEVEEYVDENGVRVRRIVKRTITTRTIKREDEKVEPVEVTFPVAQTQDESPEEVEEYTDDNGVRVRRIVKRTITTRTTVNRQGQEMAPVTVQFPLVDEGNASREEIEEYVDENGVRVRRTVERTITATPRQRRGVLETSVLESGDPVVMQRVMQETVPTTELETLEAITPEAVLLAHTPPSSPRRTSMPYETTVVQRYLVIIETLYQYVLEHKSMIFIYSSRHMQFNFVLENFLYWMLITLKTLNWMRPVSWKVDEIRTQLQQIKVFLSRGTCLHLHDGLTEIE